MGVKMALFVFLLFFMQLDFSFVLDKRPEQPQLEQILSACGDYCQKLDNASLDFICREKVQELLYPNPERIEYLYRNNPSGIIRAFKKRQTPDLKRKRNILVYDYQLIKKDNNTIEKRTLLKENGIDKRVEDASLQTLRFKYGRVLFGPIGLLSPEAQEQFDYFILDEEINADRDMIVIQARPKPDSEIDYLYGKIWVKKDDFSIKKIEWAPESIINYESVQKFSSLVGADPIITMISEYGHPKKSLLFPSRFFLEEKYMIESGDVFTFSTLEVTYSGYQFFTVETHVDFKK
jgi:hypothetical protein